MLGGEVNGVVVERENASDCKVSKVSSSSSVVCGLLGGARAEATSSPASIIVLKNKQREWHAVVQRMKTCQGTGRGGGFPLGGATRVGLPTPALGRREQERFATGLDS